MRRGPFTDIRAERNGNLLLKLTALALSGIFTLIAIALMACFLRRSLNTPTFDRALSATMPPEASLHLQRHPLTYWSVPLYTTVLELLVPNTCTSKLVPLERLTNISLLSLTFARQVSYLTVVPLGWVTGNSRAPTQTQLPFALRTPANRTVSVTPTNTDRPTHFPAPPSYKDTLPRSPPPQKVRSTLTHPISLLTS